MIGQHHPRGQWILPTGALIALKLFDEVPVEPTSCFRENPPTAVGCPENYFRCGGLPGKLEPESFRLYYCKCYLEMEFNRQESLLFLLVVRRSTLQL